MKGSFVRLFAIVAIAMLVLNLGTGLGVLFFNDPLVTPIVFGGFQAGARYYFTDKFGVNLELGYGKSIVNGGVVFNL